MKKIIRKFLIVIVLFCSITSKSQTIDTTTIEGLYQYIFNVLDKTQIPTHYLEEYLTVTARITNKNLNLKI